MSYFICNGLGDSIDNPTPAQMREFLDALDPEDEEHGAAWLQKDAEWTIEWSIDGVLSLNRGDYEALQHMTGIPKVRVLELWTKLVAGRLAEIEAEPWQPGGRPKLSAEEEERRAREYAEWQRQEDREFYDILGPERPEVPCRREGCTRGAIELSVLCRPHHFENIKDRPCPFDD